ncbi:ACR057Cp [Eremothecium gossypii ATCC 10895]|uniref:ACR057Cp n=1 Tax=Eremothecium gossypii (strain ATCC 10895 / CBS 109.51 / FGSC 9923 / NRRL Y-1056) TaxID=284811 RepID=Q75C59_EREGS|nr:ACR057Cp [Eremothecium gossypii ATCC 10895]AAS51284.1 ACR057Cp [Eremothecium gossypii ATCC 10895]AEY95575.1 FACR057Cp [Eremothecium gossypii FDAG1]
MNVPVQHLVGRYPSKEQLTLKGIWGGGLYEEEELPYLNRGWCWKTLLLSDQGEGSWFDIATSRAAATPEDSVRQLTGETAVEQDTDDAPLDDRLKEHATAQEQLQIIQLDVSRLLLDPIFTVPEVQNDMVEILRQYMLESGRPYKQGFHELCGMFYMQLYRNGYRDGIQHTTLHMFKEFIAEVAVTFYDEGNLIEWTKNTFEPILRHALPGLYEQLLMHHELDNSIWLIRWSRLLFLREFELEYTLCLWDHLLTFRYPVSQLVAAIIVVCLTLIVQELHSCEDHGDLMSILLHYPSSKLLSAPQMIRSARTLLDLWLAEQYEDMQLICDSLIKSHNGAWFGRMQAAADGGHRLRLEERLKRRVGERIRRHHSVR